MQRKLEPQWMSETFHVLIKRHSGKTVGRVESRF